MYTPPSYAHTCISCRSWCTSVTFKARISSHSFLTASGGGPLKNSSSTRTTGLSLLDASFSPCFSSPSAPHESSAIATAVDAIILCGTAPAGADEDDDDGDDGDDEDDDDSARMAVYRAAVAAALAFTVAAAVGGDDTARKIALCALQLQNTFCNLLVLIFLCE